METEIVEKEWTLGEIFQVIKKRIISILVAICACSVLGFASTYVFIKKSYQAEQSVYVRDATNDSIESLRLVPSVVDYLKDQNVWMRTADKLSNLSEPIIMTYIDIGKGLTISTNTNSLRIRILFKYHESHVSALVINNLILATQEIPLVNEAFSKFKNVLSVIRPLEAQDEEVIQLSRFLFLILGFMAGAVVGIAYAFIKEEMDNKKKKKAMAASETI